MLEDQRKHVTCAENNFYQKAIITCKVSNNGWVWIKGEGGYRWPTLYVTDY